MHDSLSTGESQNIRCPPLTILNDELLRTIINQPHTIYHAGGGGLETPKIYKLVQHLESLLLIKKRIDMHTSLKRGNFFTPCNKYQHGGINMQYFWKTKFKSLARNGTGRRFSRFFMFRFVSVPPNFTVDFQLKNGVIWKMFCNYS